MSLLLLRSSLLQVDDVNSDPVDAAFANSTLFAEYIDANPNDPVFDPPSLPGVGAHPRLTRRFAFPLSDPPRGVAVDALEDLRIPLGPPFHVYSDPLVRSTIDSNPHLFQTQPETPYNIEAFEKALVTGTHPYPHQEVALAFINGLRRGFWPCHDGYFGEVSSFDYNKTKEEWEFIEEKGNRGFEEGRMSVAFEVRPAGTSFNPTFVRTPENGGKQRWIIDGTGSKINLGIAREDTSPRYDMVTELFRVIRHVLSRPPEERRRLVLAVFKDDFKDAFWGLAVCPEWQLHQLVRFLDSNGEEYFRVDYRLQFGNRASPYLWSACAGFVMWIAREHFGLEYPMVFVDDCLGVDDQLEVVRREHKGVKFVVPVAQAKLLDAFDYVSAPYDAIKQENNLDPDTGEVIEDAIIRILGFDISPKDLTFAIPDDWKARFAASSARFDKGVALPLSEWRSWLGKANHACALVPWAKWRLNLLYRRISKVEREKGKNKPRLRYSVKEDEAEAIRWFSEQVLTTPPMSLYDAVLQVWPKNAMDVLVYADSCGETYDHFGGGLGFVISSKHLEHDLAFAYCHPAKFVHNNVAEGATVFLAFRQAIKSVPDARRVLIYSDSSDVVYAIDAGRGEDELNVLSGRMRVLGGLKKVDYRVRWIKGEHNNRADALSRESLHDLYRVWGDRLSTIVVEDYIISGAC